MQSGLDLKITNSKKITMKSFKNSVGNIVKIFAETFEDEAFKQVKALAEYEPYKHSNIRLMPDAHAGKGCTVGTTMTINDAITPNLIGVDISCGMLVAELKDTHIDFSKLDAVIRNYVPHGFDVHSSSKAKLDKLKNLTCFKKIDHARANLSIGSLGGGNHFIEVNKDENTSMLYLVIHSGSRKLGTDICSHHQNIAFNNLNECGKAKDIMVAELKKQGKQKEINEALKQFKKPSADKDLAHLTGVYLADYVNDMCIAQEYASLNRFTMANIIAKHMNIQFCDVFETVHNYIDFKTNVLRKGAVSAQLDEKLIIPMNMQDGSLICIGKGNADWNYSAPHGAGRLMSRGKAKELINMDDYKKSMEGIFTTSVNQSTIDEAPQAYKPMQEIIDAVQDTVEIVSIINPLYNFKSN